MEETDELAHVERAWRATETALPPGWTLEGLRCQSTGLDPVRRSDAWRAVARGPGGEEHSGEGATPVEALTALGPATRVTPSGG